MLHEMPFKMANGETKEYKCGSSPNNTSPIRVECRECEHFAEKISENRVSFFVDNDLGLCFKDYPEKICVMTSTLKKELKCRKL